jgi:hypothetical protein
LRFGEELAAVSLGKRVIPASSVCYLQYGSCRSPITYMINSTAAILNAISRNRFRLSFLMFDKF